MMRHILKGAATPVRNFFNPRFEGLRSGIEAVHEEVKALQEQVLSTATPAAPVDAVVLDRARQADVLDRVDVSEHNRHGRPANFDGLQCRAASAADCEDERYLAWWRLFENLPVGTAPGQPGGPSPYNRKIWEWALIAQSIEQLGLMTPGHTAVGFGCGNEPMPALLASRGMTVLATDQAVETGGEWALSNELMHGLDGLSREHLIGRAALAKAVSLRNVDMNAIPEDLGMFDVAWSSCVIEHLGSPSRGLDFVLESLNMVRPGGVAVHTTELELTRKKRTMDYGNCAVYRLQDLLSFEERVKSSGYDASFNFYVSMDSAHDRWISMVNAPGGSALDEIDHLKLLLGDSVTTSFGLIIRKP